MKCWCLAAALLASPARAQEAARAPLLKAIEATQAVIPAKAVDPINTRYRRAFADLHARAKGGPARKLPEVKAEYETREKGYRDELFAAYRSNFPRRDAACDERCVFEDYFNTRRAVALTLRLIAEDKHIRLTAAQLQGVARFRAELDDISVTTAKLGAISRQLPGDRLAQALSGLPADYRPAQRPPEAGLKAPPPAATTAAAGSSWLPNIDFQYLKNLAVKAYDGVAGTVGLCYTGVKDALIAAGLTRGYLPGVAADSFNRTVRENPRLFARKLHKVEPPTWPLPVGTIVVWDHRTRTTRMGKIYGHIEIITRVDPPEACSDHCEPFNVARLRRYAGTGLVNAYVIEPKRG